MAPSAGLGLGGGEQASSLGPRRPRGGGRPTPAREPLRRGDAAWKMTLVGATWVALRFHSLTTLSFVSTGPWKATALQVALNSRELGTPGLQGIAQPRESAPWPLVAPGALQAQPCRTRPSDSVERVAKSRHSPGLPVSASLPPTAASRLDSAERLSLDNCFLWSPWLPRCRPTLFWHLGKLLVCVICWGHGKWVGFSAPEKHAWTGFLQPPLGGLGPRVQRRLADSTEEECSLSRSGSV